MPDYSSIVISGKPHAGKSTLAERLSKIYRWPVYSVGIIWREEWKKKYPNNELSFTEYFVRTTKEENSEINKKTEDILIKGNVIGVFRYLHHIKTNNILRIFLTADVDIRAGRAMGDNSEIYKNMPRNQIRDTLIKREEDEIKLIGEGHDYNDPLYYHMVLNSGLLTVEQEIGIITHMMKNGQSG